jgi:hypothetical protein
LQSNNQKPQTMLLPYFTEPNDVKSHLLDGLDSDLNAIENGDTNFLDFYYQHILVDFNFDLNDNLLVYAYDPAKAYTFHASKVMVGSGLDVNRWVDSFASKIDAYYFKCQMENEVGK